MAPFHVTIGQESEKLTQMLREKGFEATVVPTDLLHYEGIKRKEGRWGHFLRKFSLDFPHKIETDKDLEKIVFWNITDYYPNKLALKKLPKERMILFVWEPPTTLPKMFSFKTTRYFSKIYTWDDDVIDNKTYFKLYYPVLQPMRADIPPFQEKKFCTLMGTNVPSKYYKRRGELYSERVKAIEFFEKVGEKGFEFYGRNWDAAKYSSYRGRSADKLETIKNYRFMICYENTATSNGYVTEKIFDCFAAGVVPVYLGAPNIEKYIPKNCFIDRRDFSSMEELYAFMKSMTKKQYDTYLQNIRAYLASEQAQVFSVENFNQIFFDAVTSKN